MGSLTFPNSIPPEVWGTGLAPEEWKSQDVFNLNSLRLAAASNFKLLKNTLHARKRKEPSFRESVHILNSEGNILVSDVSDGIQYGP